MDQDIRFGGALAAAAATIHAAGRRHAACCAHGRQRVRQALAKLPELIDVMDDELRHESAGVAQHRPRKPRAARRRHAHGHPDAEQLVRPAANVHALQRAEPVPCGHGGRAEYAQGPEALDQVHVIAATGQRVPLSAFSRTSTRCRGPRAATGGSLPRTTICFSLEPGVSLEPGAKAHRPRDGQIMLPATVQGRVQLGNARLFESDAGQPAAR